MGNSKNIFKSVAFIIGLYFMLLMPMAAQNLGGGDIDYFSNATLQPVGSVVVVRFVEDFTFSINAEAEKNTPNNLALQNMLEQYFSFLPNTAAAEASPKTLRVLVDDTTTGTLGAAITAYDPVSDVYTIAGTRFLNYNGVARSNLSFTAEISRKSLSEEGEVLSSQLANLNMQYQDTTSNVRLTAQDFLRLLEPVEIPAPAPTTTVAAVPAVNAPATPAEPGLAEQTPPAVQIPPVPETELTEDRKRQLLLQYINYLLRQWF